MIKLLQKEAVKNFETKSRRVKFFSGEQVEINFNTVILTSK